MGEEEDDGGNRNYKWREAASYNFSVNRGSAGLRCQVKNYWPNVGFAGLIYTFQDLDMYFKPILIAALLSLTPNFGMQASTLFKFLNADKQNVLQLAICLQAESL